MEADLKMSNDAKEAAGKKAVEERQLATARIVQVENTMTQQQEKALAEEYTLTQIIRAAVNRESSKANVEVIRNRHTESNNL